MLKQNHSASPDKLPTPAVAQVIGYEFCDPELLREALTHRSTMGQSESGERFDNERLEFLGDAVLGLVIANYLVEAKHNFSEGELSRIRSALVNEDTLSRVATRIGLGDMLMMGFAEQGQGGAKKKSILADGLEALFGAVYRDGGISVAKSVILKLFAEELSGDLNQHLSYDYKTMLQEYAQDRFKQQPSYSLIGQSGPDHAPEYKVAVSVHDCKAEGTGPSKKKASQVAAENAMNQLIAEERTCD